MPSPSSAPTARWVIMTKPLTLSHAECQGITWEGLTST